MTDGIKISASDIARVFKKPYILRVRLVLRLN